MWAKRKIMIYLITGMSCFAFRKKIGPSQINFFINLLFFQAKKKKAKIKIKRIMRQLARKL
jgi:hypothetical protein